MKDLEKIVIVVALGATAFVLWKAFLQGGRTIGDFGNKAANVPASAAGTQVAPGIIGPTAASWYATQANDPNASAGIRALYSGSSLLQ